MEVLVALALIAGFAAVFDPLLFQARHILFEGNGQIRAQLLLRTLIESSFNRLDPETGVREGESDGMSWRVSIEPFASDDDLPETPPAASDQPPGPDWELYRIKAYVFWGTRQTIMGESLRLGTVSDGPHL